MPEPKPSPRIASDAEVCAILDRYRCPVPFHAVRTRFLGNIASSVMSGSPLDALKGLWGGELPEFESFDAVNELLDVLINGLWNRLTRHQERKSPFRLVRAEPPETREGLSRMALIRREELDGFVEGLFGKEDSLELPERAHRAMNVLSELRAIFAGVVDLTVDPTKPATTADIAATRRHFRELTRIGEREIHEAVLSCARARRMMLQSVPTPRGTIH